MAHLDNLIESIKDPTLRAALRTEIDKVTKNRRLGLVFDRHLPESVTLPGFAIRQGEKVQVLVDGSDDPTELDDTGIWTVIEICLATAVLRDGSGETREVPVSQLVATREFGDPIYPGLKTTGRVVRGSGTDGEDGGKPFHTVINAENYHALEALLFAYEGQVDAIYIDPPYNTGASDWKYNNDYVDDNDPYRHSKWLSFIERRLLLAKRLLNPADSVLIVTIDEKEYLRLGLLLEQTFPGADIQMVSIIINRAGSPRAGRFSRVDEYAFYVFLGAAQVKPWTSTMLGDDTTKPEMPTVWFTAVRRGSGSGREDKKSGKASFYPVVIDAETGSLIRVGDPVPHGVSRHEVPLADGELAIWPLTNDGTENRWRFSADRMREYFANGTARLGRRDPSTGLRPITYLQPGTLENIENGTFVVTGRTAEGALELALSDTVTKVVAPRTVWNRTSHFARDHGSNLNGALLGGRRFPFPKSLYAVEDSLRFVLDSKPDALVLDFFSGSGTTAHAVMRLNRQDGGRRRSISVTNNEVSPQEAAQLTASGHRPGDHEWEALGICEYITKPRIKAAITGRTPDGDPIKGEYRFIDTFPMSDGLAENVEFFDLTYEDPALVSLGRRFEAIAPLLWLRAGAIGVRIDDVAEEGWAIPSDAVYGVLFDTTAWGTFVSAAAKREDLRHAFIVTDSIVEYQQIVAKLDPALKTTRLYADYLRNFEINTRR